jgi:hypothetical protein
MDNLISKYVTAFRGRSDITLRQLWPTRRKYSSSTSLPNSKTISSLPISPTRTRTTTSTYQLTNRGKVLRHDSHLAFGTSFRFIELRSNKTASKTQTVLPRAILHCFFDYIKNNGLMAVGLTNSCASWMTLLEKRPSSCHFKVVNTRHIWGWPGYNLILKKIIMMLNIIHR